MLYFDILKKLRLTLASFKDLAAHAQAAIVVVTAAADALPAEILIAKFNLKRLEANALSLL